jgi:hypothetical protein
MADGFIVRRGGKVSEQALAPTITEVSVTDSSITFTIKNEDTEKAIIRYRIDDIDAEGEIIELAGGATSSNITASGLDAETEYIVFATANVTGKVKSNVTQLAIETAEPIIYTAATGGTTNEYDDGGKRYKAHTFTTNGTFEITTLGNGDRNKGDILIVSGGGSGGASGGIGGGGGGGAVGYYTNQTLLVQSYSVNVGAGGVVTISNGSAAGNPGAASSFDNISVSVSNQGKAITALGFADGGDSKSIIDFVDTNYTGGLGDGNPRAGGGGASSVSNGGNGNAGVSAGQGADGTNAHSILATATGTGSNGRYGGGGSGGFEGSGTIARTPGGLGGGGDGGAGTTSPNFNATNGLTNTGGGGGGCGGQGGVVGGLSGNGGSGIVIIRYEIAPSV